MRTIKFRGKRVDNGEWVYGNLLLFGSVYEIMPQVGIGPIVSRRVHPETVGQFTGLLDKDGNEIYEGHVVSLHFFYEALGENLGVYEAEKEIKGEIAFQELGLWIECNTEEDSGYLLWINGVHEESYKIIGNIHDNPELINQ